MTTGTAIADDGVRPRVSGVSGAFTSSDTSAAFTVSGAFNVSIWGTFVGTLQLERSFDDGTTWLPCTDDSGTTKEWTAPMTIVVDEPEPRVQYRLNCTAYTSGTANFRLSQ